MYFNVIKDARPPDACTYIGRVMTVRVKVITARHCKKKYLFNRNQWSHWQWAIIDTHRICKSAGDRCLVTYYCTARTGCAVDRIQIHILKRAQSVRFIALDWHALPCSCSVLNSPFPSGKRFLPPLPRLRLEYSQCGCCRLPAVQRGTDTPETIN